MASAVAPVPVSWLVAQRWYQSSYGPPIAVNVADEELICPNVVWRRLAAELRNGQRVDYQVFWDGSSDVAGTAEVRNWAFPDLAELHTADVRVPRLLEPGPHPDFAVAETLWSAGWRGVAEPLGVCRRGELDLAVARRSIGRSASGLAMAVSDPWFLREVGDLGRFTAEMHSIIPNHGDFHLGRLRHSKGRWNLDSFGRGVPLDDVASLCQSFAHAAAVAGHDANWLQKVEAEFLNSYAH